MRILYLSILILITFLFTSIYISRPLKGLQSMDSKTQKENIIPINFLQNNHSVHDFKMLTIDGKEKNLADYKGKVLVIVNVASKCGYTKQYKEIQEFYNSYKDKGVEVLGFPANNFMGQEPGTDLEIKEFCTRNFGVTFPMFSKISVKGNDIHPLYEYLTKSVNNEISWNFNKIIVDQSGKPVKYYPSKINADNDDFIGTIKSLLK